MTSQSIELLPVKESITLTPSEWYVIAMVYKYRDLDKLKARLNVNPDQLTRVLKKLQDKKFIKLIKTLSHPSIEIPTLFWEKLEKELSRCIGPIAPLVIDDTIEEFNKSRDNFPHKMLYNLLEKISLEINTSDGKQQFQKTMLEVIKQY